MDAVTMPSASQHATSVASPGSTNSGTSAYAECRHMYLVQANLRGQTLPVSNVADTLAGHTVTSYVCSPARFAHLHFTNLLIKNGSTATSCRT